MTKRSNSNWGWLLGVLVAAALTAALMTSQGKRHPVRTPVSATGSPQIQFGYRTGGLLDWERPLGLDRTTLGTARDEFWKGCHSADWDRVPYDDPAFEIWRSNRLPKQQVAFSPTGEVVAITGEGLTQGEGQSGYAIASATRSEDAVMSLGPPDKQEQTIRGETWLWTRHPRAGYLKLYVKHLTFALSKDEDTPF